MNKRIINLAIVAVLLLPGLVLAAEDFPAFPMSFYGTANLNDTPLAAGTVIQVYNGDNLAGEVTITEAGIYGYDNPTKARLVVGEYTGDLIFKYVPTGTNDPLTGDTAIAYTVGFATGEAIEKNLEFTKKPTTPPTPPTSTSGGGGGGGGGGSFDATPPAQPAQFSSRRGEMAVYLSWVNPKDSDFKEVVLTKSQTAIDTSLSGKDLSKYTTQVYHGTGQAYTDSEAASNTLYYYAITAYDNRANYSKPVVILVSTTTEVAAAKKYLQTIRRSRSRSWAPNTTLTRT